MMKGRLPQQRRKHRRPFWLPASTFYFLSSALALSIFFLVWAILLEGREENPWIAAGLVASTSMVAAVVVREVVMRNRRDRIFAAQRRLDNSVLSAPINFRKEPDPDKLTLERNAILLDEIRKKSVAANVLGKLPESHSEVIRLCEAYIEIAVRELPNVGVGSPRLRSITRGRTEAEKLHRSHMLRWAEVQAKAHVRESSEAETSAARLSKARKALMAVERALVHYPTEPDLLGSQVLLDQLVAGSRVTAAFESAQDAESSGDHLLALDEYREAEGLLAVAGDDSGNIPLKDEIRLNVERLEKLVGEK